MTEQELENVLKSIRVVQKCQHDLVELQDYIDQIAHMARIMTHYGHLFPAHDDLQVRMIGRMAEQGSEILLKAEEKIDQAIGNIGRVAWDIELEKLREQDVTIPQCSHCSNQLQVTTNGKVN